MLRKSSGLAHSSALYRELIVSAGISSSGARVCTLSSVSSLSSWIVNSVFQCSDKAHGNGTAKGEEMGVSPPNPASLSWERTAMASASGATSTGL